MSKMDKFSGSTSGNDCELVPLMPLAEPAPEVEQLAGVKPKYAEVREKEPPQSLVDIRTSRRASVLANDIKALNSNFIESAIVGDISWAQRCLSNGASPETTCREYGISICHLLAFFGMEGILEDILDRNGDLVRRGDKSGRTILHFAAWKGQLGCIAVVLGLSKDDRASLSKWDKIDDELPEGSWKPEKSRAELLDRIEGEEVKTKQVCDFGHDCTFVTTRVSRVWDKCTPLHVACARLEVQAVGLLLAAGARTDARDSEGLTPLDVCGTAFLLNLHTVKPKAFERTIEAIINFSKKHNIDCEQLHTKNHPVPRTTPLHLAVLFKDRRATQLLLSIDWDVASHDEDGQTALHLAVLQRSSSSNVLKVLANASSESEQNTIELKNKEGYTPLQMAVKIEWKEGVDYLLEAGADVLSSDNEKNENSLHLVAETGNIDLLDKLIWHNDKIRYYIDATNAAGETPLIKAIANGRARCVRGLLHSGASNGITINGFTVLHKAVETEEIEVLEALLETENINDFREKPDEKNGMTPLHWAAYKNQPHFVRRFMEYGCDSKKMIEKAGQFHGFTPLHVAASEDNAKVVEVMIEMDRSLMNIKDAKGWLPVHTAIFNCHRKSSTLFLKNGANFSEPVPQEKGKLLPLIQVLTNNMPRSSEYLHDLFNSCITSNNYDLDQPTCEVTVDYSMIMGNKDDENFSFTQMNVIVDLFSTGNKYDQEKLLLHPFIESFLYFKWKILKRFFYGILTLYTLFVILTTLFAVRLYKDLDKSGEDSKDTSEEPKLHENLWIGILIITAVTALIELLFIKQKGWKYFKWLESWIKMGSFVLAVAMVVLYRWPTGTEWPRYVTTSAILLAWVELIMLLSRIPMFGFYFQMFSTVAMRLMKVVGLFGCFLVVGFSLVFWILFRSQEPFTTPWNALIKTIVMTSELDYSSLFENPKDLTDQVVLQIFFIIFIVLVPVVMMNLVLALAVSDVKDLQTEGKIQRLAEQVDFMGTLEVLAWSILLEQRIKSRFKKWVVQDKISMFPGSPSWKSLNEIPQEIVDSIYMNLNKRDIKDNIAEQMSEIMAKVEKFMESGKKNDINIARFADDTTRIENTNTERHQQLLDLFNKSKESTTMVVQKYETQHQELLSVIDKLSEKIQTLKVSSSESVIL